MVVSNYASARVSRTVLQKLGEQDFAQGFVTEAVPWEQAVALYGDRLAFGIGHYEQDLFRHSMR